MSGLLLRLERAFETFRHVPPRQLLRRLELTGRRRLATWLPDHIDRTPPDPINDQPPLPIFPARRLLEQEDDHWHFKQPWGSLELTSPVDWGLAATDPEKFSWRANLSYMEFLEGIDDRAFAEFVEVWIEDNPPDASAYSWRSYNLSIRLVVWMQQIAARWQRLEAGFLARVAISLAEQLRWLERYLETDIRGNHLIRNIKALLWASAFFTGDEAKRWGNLGRALLKEEIDTQILADGCHFERSPSYHCQVLGDLLEILGLLGAEPLRRRLETALVAMARACVLLTHPDGKVALFNDGGLDLAYAPAVLLDAFGQLGFDRPAREDGPFALPEAGFYGLIAGDAYLVVDCGPIGPDALIGHAHDDILSFEWSVGGRRLIVDQGTYQYRAGSRRVQSRAAAAHNTVAIDGMEPSDFFGEFRCGRRARPRVLEHRAQGDGFVLAGTHDGFRKCEGRPQHIRRIKAAPGRIIIEDRVESAGRYQAVAGLLLHPDCRITVAGPKVRITSGPVEIMIESPTAPTVETAEWFPDLHVRLPTHRLRYRWTVPGEAMRLVLHHRT